MPSIVIVGAGISGLSVAFRLRQLAPGAAVTILEEAPRRRGDGRDESIDAFVRRRAGREAAEVLADALVTGIYAGDSTLLSLPACFPRLAQFEREAGSVIRGFIRAAKKRRTETKVRGST